MSSGLLRKTVGRRLLSRSLGQRGEESMPRALSAGYSQVEYPQLPLHPPCSTRNQSRLLDLRLTHPRAENRGQSYVSDTDHGALPSAESALNRRGAFD